MRGTSISLMALALRELLEVQKRSHQAQSYPFNYKMALQRQVSVQCPFPRWVLQRLCRFCRETLPGNGSGMAFPPDGGHWRCPGVLLSHRRAGRKEGRAGQSPASRCRPSGEVFLKRSVNFGEPITPPRYLPPKSLPRTF